jgi:ankyrin repeat protein
MIRRFAGLGLVGALAVALATTSSRGHETDQYTIPPGREMADLGPYITAFFHERLERAVAQLNDQIRHAPNDAAAQQFYRPTVVADYTCKSLPDAYTAIESLEHLVHTQAMQDHYPGQIVGYKNQLKASYSHLPIDPRQIFKFWFASTLKVYGHYVGCDKVGHFIDMGKRYYDEVQSRVASGMSEEAALKQVMDKFGGGDVIFSEGGVLGYWSAGAYSNGDLASNYCGMLMYRNLTQPTKLKGVVRPPMFVRDGKYWKLADRVRRDSDWYAWLVDDSWDEALNPSLYDGGLRGGTRDNVRKRGAVILWRYRDEHGCVRPPRWFHEMVQQNKTYYGADYAHRGDFGELITIDMDCFLPPQGKAVNALGHTPLHYAAFKGDLATARRLVQQKADVNAPIVTVKPFTTDVGQTPLHLAAADGNVEMVRLLLDHGANVNAKDLRDVTPLHRAAGSAAVAQLLVERGADMNAADDTGETPLHWAAREQRGGQTLAMLLGRGAVVKKDVLGRTPLHHAAERGIATAIPPLARAQGDANAVDAHGATALHLAARGGHGECVDELLSASARADVADEFGYTPLHFGAMQGRETVLKSLLAASPRPNVTDVNGVTPLHLAARGRHAADVAVLLGAGADVNVKSASGLTPLHEAAMAGDPTIAEALMSRGAQATVKAASGQTPLDAARARNHNAVVSVMTGDHSHVLANPSGMEAKR